MSRSGSNKLQTYKLVPYNFIC